MRSTYTEVLRDIYRGRTFLKKGILNAEKQQSNRIGQQIPMRSIGILHILIFLSHDFQVS